MPFKLHIIIASTRPGRVGPSVAQWFHNEAVGHGAFDVELVDLAAFNLPLFDEPKHPRLQDYAHEHTRSWARSVRSADAFVIVTPEYNFGPPPALLNALTYLSLEWNYAPLGVVSYGGLSGGLRSTQVVRHMATSFKMVPLVESVAVPFVVKHIGEDKTFVATDEHKASAATMLDELLRWTEALKALRSERK
jgi:NAD(P)H-dependent FMN reductase